MSEQDASASAQHGAKQSRLTRMRSTAAEKHRAQLMSAFRRSVTGPVEPLSQKGPKQQPLPKPVTSSPGAQALPKPSDVTGASGTSCSSGADAIATATISAVHALSPAAAKVPDSPSHELPGPCTPPTPLRTSMSEVHVTSLALNSNGYRSSCSGSHRSSHIGGSPSGIRVLKAKWSKWMKKMKGKKAVAAGGTDVYVGGDLQGKSNSGGVGQSSGLKPFLLSSTTLQQHVHASSSNASNSSNSTASNAGKHDCLESLPSFVAGTKPPLNYSTACQQQLQQQLAAAIASRSSAASVNSSHLRAACYSVTSSCGEIMRIGAEDEDCFDSPASSFTFSAMGARGLSDSLWDTLCDSLDSLMQTAASSGSSGPTELEGGLQLLPLVHTTEAAAPHPRTEISHSETCSVVMRSPCSMAEPQAHRQPQPQLPPSTAATPTPVYPPPGQPLEPPEVQMIWPLCLSSGAGRQQLSVKLSTCCPVHSPAPTPSCPGSRTMTYSCDIPTMQTSPHSSMSQPVVQIASSQQQQQQSPRLQPSLSQPSSFVNSSSSQNLAPACQCHRVSVCFMSDEGVLAEASMKPDGCTAQGSIPPYPHPYCSLAVITAFAVAAAEGQHGEEEEESGSAGADSSTCKLPRSSSAQLAPGPATSLLSVPEPVSMELHAWFSMAVQQVMNLEVNPSLPHVHIRDTNGYVYLPGKGSLRRQPQSCTSRRSSMSMDVEESSAKCGHSSPLGAYIWDGVFRPAGTGEGRQWGEPGPCSGGVHELLSLSRKSAPPCSPSKLAVGPQLYLDPNNVQPPWTEPGPLRHACQAVWSRHYQPLVRDLAYLILCVPGMFGRISLNGTGSGYENLWELNATAAAGASGLSAAWDRKTYCQCLVKMVGFLEYYKMWHTLAAVLSHAAQHGVVTKCKGVKLEASNITPASMQLIMEQALSNDITVQYCAEDAAGAGEVWTAAGAAAGSMGQPRVAAMVRTKSKSNSVDLSTRAASPGVSRPIAIPQSRGPSDSGALGAQACAYSCPPALPRRAAGQQPGSPASSGRRGMFCALRQAASGVVQAATGSTSGRAASGSNPGGLIGGFGTVTGLQAASCSWGSHLYPNGNHSHGTDSDEVLYKCLMSSTNSAVRPNNSGNSSMSRTAGSANHAMTARGSIDGADLWLAGEYLLADDPNTEASRLLNPWPLPRPAEGISSRCDMSGSMSSSIVFGSKELLAARQSYGASSGSVEVVGVGMGAAGGSGVGVAQNPGVTDPGGSQGGQGSKARVQREEDIWHQRMLLEQLALIALCVLAILKVYL